MNDIEIIYYNLRKSFKSLDKQRDFHLKNLNMMDSKKDRHDYIKTLKEDYMYDLFYGRNKSLREYNLQFRNNLIIESKLSHRTEVNKFFDFIKKSILFETDLFDKSIYKINITEHFFSELHKAQNYLISQIGAKEINNLKKSINEGLNGLFLTEGGTDSLLKSLISGGKVALNTADDVAKNALKTQLDDVVKSAGGKIGNFKSADEVFNFLKKGGSLDNLAKQELKMGLLKSPNTAKTVKNAVTSDMLKNSANIETFNKVVSSGKGEAGISKLLQAKGIPVDVADDIAKKHVLRMNKTTQTISKKSTDAVKGVTKKSEKIAKDVTQKGNTVTGKLSGYMTQVLNANFKKWLPGLTVAGIGSTLAYEAYTNWNTLINMSLEDWVEAFRKWLGGFAGIAIQIILALSGIGSVLNIAAHSFLLIYDVGIKGVGDGNWNWYNIITGLMSLLGTGLASYGFRFLKGLSTGITPKAFGPTLLKTNPAAAKTTLPVMEQIGKGVGFVVRKVSEGLSWFLSKIPLVGRVVPKLQTVIGKFGTALDDFANGVSNSTKLSSNVGQGVKRHFVTSSLASLRVRPGANFDTKHLTQKLVSKTDGKIAKGTVGQFTDDNSYS